VGLHGQLLVEGIVKAFFLLIPLLAAAAPQMDEWFLAGRKDHAFHCPCWPNGEMI